MSKITFDQLPDLVASLHEKLDRIERIISQNNNATCTESDELLTVEQTAEFLRLSVATVYSKVSRGELPVMKRSKRLYFSRTELIEYLKSSRKKTNDELAIEAAEYLKNKKGGAR